jgi:hypothetical protein
MKKKIICDLYAAGFLRLLYFSFFLIETGMASAEKVQKRYDSLKKQGR